MNSKLKIYFYSPCVTTFFRPVEHHAKMPEAIFVNPTPLYLDSYVKQHSPELIDKYEWTKLQYLPVTRKQFTEDLDSLEIDMVALSIYTWNQQTVLSLIKNIHQDLKKPVKFIIGGPSVDVVRNDKWLLDLPEIEFAIYAQGEVAFVSVLKHYLGIEKINVLRTKNVAWIEKGKVKKADYEFTKIKSGSPIAEGEHLLRKISEDPQLQGRVLQFPYETSRGCAYKCSFCDWTSGLSHKMSKRKFHFEDELEVLGKVGILDLYLADSNFGLYEEDVEIARTMARLKQEKNYNFYIHGSNFSKTKKDNVFKIADIIASAKLTEYLKFSIQDINKEVLKNVDRPDIAWEKHIEYILKLRKDHPDVIMAVDIINGLPGQTRKTWEKMYQELCYHNIYMHIYDWEVIPNSPAGYDEDYRNRMKLKNMVIHSDIGTRELVVETISYNLQDYAYFKVLHHIYNLYFRNHAPAFPKFIKLINQLESLDSYLNDISSNLADGELFYHRSKAIMQTIFKNNHNKLSLEFIKKVLLNNGKPMTGLISEDEVAIVKPTSKTAEQIIAEVFLRPEEIK